MPAKRPKASDYVEWERRRIVNGALREVAAVRRPDGVLLEIGCGSGWLLAGLITGGIEPHRLMGVETDPARARAARKNCPGATILADSGAKVPLDAGSASAVIMASVLSTVDASERDALLAEARRVLAPDGILVIYEHRRRWMTRDPYPTPYSALRRVIGDAASKRTLGLIPPLRVLRGSLLFSLLSALRLTRSHYLAVFPPPAVPPRPGGSPTQIAMLVRNSGMWDTRVRKEAASLQRSGYRVRVIALAEEQLERAEMLDGVEYIRIAVRRMRLGKIAADFQLAQAGARKAYMARTERFRNRRQQLVNAYKTDVRERNERLASRLQAVKTADIPDERRMAEVDRLRGDHENARRATKASFERRSERIKQRAARSRKRYQRATERRKRRYERRVRRYRAWVPLHAHLDYDRAVRPVLTQLDPDVVHAHDLNTLYAAFRYTIRRRRKLIYDSHELELHRNKKWTRRDRVVSRLVEALGITKARRTITVGPEIAADLRRVYRIRLPAVVLNSPPCAAADRSVDRDIRSLAGVERSTVLMAYVGGIGPNRGVEYVIEALTLLPERFHLAILGPRRDDLDSPLREQAAGLNVRHRLHMLDPVPAADVAATLRGASLCVIPIQKACRSYDLCMPNKLFDAVMAGLPIVAASLRSLIEFLDEHRLGIVFDETDPRSIAEAVTRLTSSTPEGVRDSAALRALQRSVAWERQAETLRDLYRTLLEPAEPARAKVTEKAA